ncbi:MAG: hypothetical protein KJO42_16565 [Silicimonas sp.]|nr:hypothetical protein [Silicimonas sp.]
MKDSTLDETVIDTLQAALDSERLPTAAREYAQHLLRRLGSPVRVSVLGLPMSGKSELINMFVGRRLFPKDAQLPTTEIVHGDVERMTVTGADGKVDVTDKIDLEQISGSNAAFLKIELPAPILRRVSLLEVVTDGTIAELSSAVDWSVRRTDIALWCSQSFAEDEQAVWHRVPDSLKDHAFLVLTKADVLSAKESLSKQVAALETIVAEEFHSLFAVATLQAVKAHRGDGAVDETMYHASGGGALTAEILRHAERGRRADFDGAHLFLARYKIQPAAGAHKSTETPTAAKAPPEPAERPSLVEEPAKPAAVVAESAPERPENPELFADAIRFLKRRGETLGNSVAKLGEGKANALIPQCVDAVEHLVDLFSQDESGCPAADAFLDELAEASDIMVLMQVEAGDGPAADAATLLLQLRRDMEMKLAA